jgi:DNA repair protein RadC
MTTDRSDSGSSYSQPMTDEAILSAAEEVLWHRVHRGDLMHEPSAAGRFLRYRLAAKEHEVFCVMFLDNRHRVIAVENLFTGTIDGCEVYPREILKRSLHHNASAVILGHNHPSGNCEPSAADRAVTLRIRDALTYIEVRLLDHFVVGCDGEPTSLAQRGWL